MEKLTKVMGNKGPSFSFAHGAAVRKARAELLRIRGEATESLLRTCSVREAISSTAEGSTRAVQGLLNSPCRRWPDDTAEGVSLTGDQLRIVPGYSGRYAVSPEGEVWELYDHRAVTYAPRPMRVYPSAVGGSKVSLIRPDGLQRLESVKRLVWCAMHPGDSSRVRLCIKHLDGNAANNYAGNLASNHVGSPTDDERATPFDDCDETACNGHESLVEI